MSICVFCRETLPEKKNLKLFLKRARKSLKINSILNDKEKLNKVSEKYNLKQSIVTPVLQEFVKKSKPFLLDCDCQCKLRCHFTCLLRYYRIETTKKTKLLFDKLDPVINALGSFHCPVCKDIVTRVFSPVSLTLFDLQLKDKFKRNGLVWAMPSLYGGGSHGGVLGVYLGTHGNYQNFSRIKVLAPFRGLLVVPNIQIFDIVDFYYNSVINREDFSLLFKDFYEKTSTKEPTTFDGSFFELLKFYKKNHVLRKQKETWWLTEASFRANRKYFLDLIAQHLKKTVCGRIARGIKLHQLPRPSNTLTSESLLINFLLPNMGLDESVETEPNTDTDSDSDTDTDSTTDSNLFVENGKRLYQLLKQIKPNLDKDTVLRAMSTQLDNLKSFNINIEKTPWQEFTREERKKCIETIIETFP